MSRKRSAGVIVVRRSDDGWRVLLLRIYKNWDFPKGTIEEGETPLEAAMRETREETLVDDLAFRWGEDFRETEPYARGKITRYYVAESPAAHVDLPIAPNLGRPEHHEFRWLGFDAARRVLPSRLQPILDWAQSVLESDG